MEGVGRGGCVGGGGGGEGGSVDFEVGRAAAGEVGGRHGVVG